MNQHIQTGTSVSFGVGSYSYSYDDLNEPTEYDTTYSGLSTSAYKQTYAHYPDASLETNTLHFGSTSLGAFTYSYDKDGRMT